MSASLFEFGSDELGELVTALMSPLADLFAATERVRSGDIGAAGHPELEAALSDVILQLGTGIGQIHDSLQELQGRVTSAVGIYESADSAVADKFKG